MKRVQEHQIESRYSNSRVVEEEPNPGTGIERASQDVLERRKIVSVSRRKFGAGTASKTPSSAAPAAATASSAPNNPFASTILARPTTTTTATSAFLFNSGGNQPSQSSQPKTNPFANVTFTNSNSGATKSSMAPPPAAPPKFSFTSSTVTPSISSTAYQPPAANSTFAIGTSNSTTPSSQTMTALAKRNKEMRDLNILLWQTIIDLYEGGHKADDYSGFLKEYLEHADKIQEAYEAAEEEEEENGLSNESKPSASSVTSKGTSTSNQPQPASSSWSLFGATAPAAAPSSTDRPSVPFSFSATGPSSSTPSFSFGATTSAASSTNSSAPTFSFGATASAPSTTSSHTVSNVGGGEENEEEDDPTANPDDGKVEFVERAENTEEEVLYEVRAIPLKKENTEWKKRATGALRVYRHKVTRTHRMAVRNEYGKVHFNVAVSSGMKFEKVEKNGKGGKKVTYVRFVAVEEESKGGELFMLQVKPESLDELHNLLTSLV